MSRNPLEAIPCPTIKPIRNRDPNILNSEKSVNIKKN